MKNTLVPVEYAPGRLPVFWDRSVLFFANLQALFFGNTGATQELIDRVGGVETYGGRLCPLINLLFAGSNNLLVLETSPDEDLLRYFAEDLGLGLPELAVLEHVGYEKLPDELASWRQRRESQHPDHPPRAKDTDHLPVIAKIAEQSAEWIDGFVTDEVLTRAAAILGKRTIVSSEASRRCNNKLLLHEFLSKHGFPVFDTVIAEDATEIPQVATVLRSKGYRRMVAKAQVGASGIGMRILATDDPRLDVVVEHLFYEGPCLVQGWLDGSCPGVQPVGSPSVQLFLNDTTVSAFDVTEQILSSESVHEGNGSPPPYWKSLAGIEDEIRKQVVGVGRWLHEGGYRGTASADFLVVKRSGSLEVFLCEVNARVTGATYPSVLARRFCPDGYWLMRNLRFETAIFGGDLLEALRQTHRLLDKQSREGVLPINFNLDRSRRVVKGQFLCLGPDEHSCLEYLMAAASVLPVKWTYDRD